MNSYFIADKWAKFARIKAGSHLGQTVGGGGGGEGGEEGAGALGSIFAGYVPLASQSSYPIIVYFVANYSLPP